MKMKLLRQGPLTFLLWVGFECVACSKHRHPLISDDVLRDDTNKQLQQHRALQQNSKYYYESSSFGSLNYDVTLGNPMKGIIANPDNAKIENWPEKMGSSMQFYKRGLDTVMLGDPDVVGPNNAFNWTIVDQMLETCTQYRHHAVLRWYIHWPGKSVLNIPPYLLEPPYNVVTLQNRGDTVPYYGDLSLRKAIQQFIKAFGAKYDGDKRIFAIQAGLIGAWGEWHTQGCKYNGDDCDPAFVYEEVIQWYKESFRSTYIQIRHPNLVSGYQAKFGFHDDSFTYSTIDGVPNGGVEVKSFFVSKAKRFNTSDFWKFAPMGGEVRPENSDVFTPGYPAGTEWHQDFNVCVRATKTTYMAWIRGFVRGGVGDGPEQNSARFASARMGYNYVVKKVGIADAGNGRVNIDVTIRHVGIAPFYYPLWLNALCDGSKKADSIIREGLLLSDGDETVITLQGIPATQACFQSIELQLGSSYTYPDKPIKWALGSDGRAILTNVPLPPNGGSPSPPVPVAQPVRVPTPTSEPQPVPIIPVAPIPIAPVPIAPVPIAPARVPRPQVQPSPIALPTSNDGKITSCFVACAAKHCGPNYQVRGTDLQIVQSGSQLSFQQIGTNLSIRCDVVGTNIGSVVFTWPTNQQNTERYVPYTMKGNRGQFVYAVPYLSSVGTKEVTIRVFNTSNQLSDTRTLTFTLAA